MRAIKCRILRNLIDLLGRERYEPAVPILARLWKDCALQPVWVAVGHALFKIATTDAMAVLLSSIEDQDSFARHMAIKAAFARGSSAAFDYLDERFGIADGKHWILVYVLYFLRDGGIGSDPEDCLKDPRWLELVCPPPPTSGAWLRRARGAAHRNNDGPGARVAQG